MLCRCYQLELSEASENRPNYLLHTPTLCSIRRPHGTSSIRPPVLYFLVLGCEPASKSNRLSPDQTATRPYPSHDGLPEHSSRPCDTSDWQEQLSLDFLGPPNNQYPPTTKQLTQFLILAPIPIQPVLIQSPHPAIHIDLIASSSDVLKVVKLALISSGTNGQQEAQILSPIFRADVDGTP